MKINSAGNKNAIKINDIRRINKEGMDTSNSHHIANFMKEKSNEDTAVKIQIANSNGDITKVSNINCYFDDKTNSIVMTNFV